MTEESARSIVDALNILFAPKQPPQLTFDAASAAKCPDARPSPHTRTVALPGHCPGQVCLQIDEVLLSADHVLPHTSPHLAPESITPSTGLGHYLDSLEQIAAVPGIRLALGGHEGPIHNLYERIAQIEASHARKLERLRAACASEKARKG